MTNKCTPNVLSVSPWGSSDRVAVFELKADMVNSRYSRNILYSRAAAKAVSNIATQSSVSLDPPAQGTTPISWTFTGNPSNSATAVSSSQPIDVLVTTSTGAVLMESTTLMLLTSNIISLVITNNGSNRADIVVVHI